MTCDSAIETMATSTISRTTDKIYNINYSDEMYALHNRLVYQEPHLVVIASGVMKARAGVEATGYGICIRLQTDVVDFVVVAGYYIIAMRVSENSVTRRLRASLTEYQS